MRSTLLLAISIGLAMTTHAKEMVTVELPGATLAAKDGFRARIEPDVFTQKDPHGRKYFACTFDIYVPRRVGKTTLGNANLQIVGRDDRNLAEITMQNEA